MKFSNKLKINYINILNILEDFFKYCNNNILDSDLLKKFASFSNNFLEDKKYIHKKLLNVRQKKRILIKKNIIENSFKENINKAITIRFIIDEYRKRTNKYFSYNTMIRYIKDNMGGKYINKKYRNKKLLDIHDKIKTDYFVNNYIEMKERVIIFSG